MNTSTEPTHNHFPASSARRRRLAAPVLVCLAVAVVILIGGSLFWLLRGDGNATAHNSRARATSTVTATPVPTWSPTEATPPPNAIFYDDFANNSRGWTLSGSDGYFRILVNNTLILADTNPNTPLLESVNTSVDMSDYLISVDFTIEQGDAHDSIGLYLRGDSTLDHDYRIDINGNNTIDVAKEWLDANQSEQTTMLVPPQRASNLNPPGQKNTLTAILIGSTLTVEINGVVAASASDAAYSSGQIALFVRHGTSPSGVTVSFSWIEIDRLASPYDTPTPTPTVTPTPKTS